MHLQIYRSYLGYLGIFNYFEFLPKNRMRTLALNCRAFLLSEEVFINKTK